MTPNTPAFGVIPQSCVFNPLPPEEAGGRSHAEQMQQELRAAGAYQELPLYAPAGTCCLYDISLFHSRVDTRDGTVPRRALQAYYSRADVPALTDWVVLPKRLAEHSDPAVRDFFSLQAAVPLCAEFAAKGYDARAMTAEQRQTLRVGEAIG